MNAVLSGWNEGPVRAAIMAFVEQTVAKGVPVAERVAVFDADGTLWCEKPVPVEAVFVLRRLEQMAQVDPTLRESQPWKAAYEHDTGWFNTVITEHYAGDDSKVATLLKAIGSAFAGIEVEDFVAQSGAFMRGGKNAELGRGYLQSAYAPMVELLGYLAANGFSTHIVSGSGSDFMRAISQDVFGIPLERVIGSENVLEYTSDAAGGRIMRKAQLSFLDDGPQKPLQIWSHIGRRPLLAGGNSNGDLPMLDFTRNQDQPTLRLLVLHDDAEREFAYTSGAENALEGAQARGITVVSMKNDFRTVFAS